MRNKFGTKDTYRANNAKSEPIHFKKNYKLLIKNHCADGMAAMKVFSLHCAHFGRIP